MYPGQGYPAPMGGFPPQPMMPQQPQYFPTGPLSPYPHGGHPQGFPQQPPAPPQPGYYPGQVAPVAPVTAVFDSGARFNKNGPITVPPPPPGYMPTPAQAAAMNGQSVHVQKEKNGFFSGGKGAGFTFW